MNKVSKISQMNSTNSFISPNVPKPPRYLVIHHKSEKVVIVAGNRKLAEYRADELMKKEKQMYIIKKDGSNESM